jgi:excisionase family DNA binding protein
MTAGNEAQNRTKAHTLREVGELINTGQTKLFELVKSGRLKSHKLGRKRLVLDTDLDEFLRALPTK